MKEWLVVVRATSLIIVSHDLFVCFYLFVCSTFYYSVSNTEFSSTRPQMGMMGQFLDI